SNRPFSSNILRATCAPVNEEDVTTFEYLLYVVFTFDWAHNGIIINKIKYIIYAPNDMIHPPTISSPIVNNSQINDESQRWRSFSCCFIALYFLQLTYVNTEIITVEIIIKMIVNGYNCPSYNGV